jgi:hypothetical protein
MNRHPDISVLLILFFASIAGVGCSGDTGTSGASDTRVSSPDGVAAGDTSEPDEVEVTDDVSTTGQQRNGLELSGRYSGTARIAEAMYRTRSLVQHHEGKLRGFVSVSAGEIEGQTDSYQGEWFHYSIEGSVTGEQTATLYMSGAHCSSAAANQCTETASSTTFTQVTARLNTETRELALTDPEPVENKPTGNVSGRRLRPFDEAEMSPVISPTDGVNPVSGAADPLRWYGPVWNIGANQIREIFDGQSCELVFEASKALEQLSKLSCSETQIRVSSPEPSLVEGSFNYDQTDKQFWFQLTSGSQTFVFVGRITEQPITSDRRTMEGLIAVDRDYWSESAEPIAPAQLRLNDIAGGFQLTERSNM